MNEEHLSEILINTTDEMALIELFEARTKIGGHWMGLTATKSGALDDLIRRLDGRHALDYIPYAVKLMLDQVEKDRFITALALTWNLIKKSPTKPVINPICVHKKEIEERVYAYDHPDATMLWHNILTWYQLS